LNIESIPPCKNLMPGWNNQESQKKSTSVILQNSFSSSNLSHNVDNGNNNSFTFTAAVAAWQRRWQWRQSGGSGSGGSLMGTQWQRWQRGNGSSVAVVAAWRQWRGSMVAAVVA
jgi:hypothetical protein